MKNSLIKRLFFCVPFLTLMLLGLLGLRVVSVSADTACDPDNCLNGSTSATETWYCGYCPSDPTRCCDTWQGYTTQYCYFCNRGGWPNDTCQIGGCGGFGGGGCSGYTPEDNPFCGAVRTRYDLGCCPGGGGGEPPPGGGCSWGNNLTEVSCQDAAQNATTGLWARFWTVDDPALLKGQGVYREPGEGANGYWNGNYINVYPGPDLYPGDIQLLPGVCINWMTFDVRGEIEVDHSGDYTVSTELKNVWSDIGISNIPNDDVNYTIVANTNGQWPTQLFEESRNTIINFPSPGWYHVYMHGTTNDEGPFIRINLFHAGSSWYDNFGGGWFVMKPHTRPCGPTCTTPTATLSKSPASVYECAPYTITWSSTNAVSCSLKENGTQIDTRLSGTLTITKTVANNYIYELTCTNSCGETVTRTVTETVSANTCSLTTSATPVNMCQPYNINWNSAGATSCTLSGAGSGSGISGTLPQSKNLPGTNTYNLSCDTACVPNKNCSVSVVVNPITATIIPPGVNPWMCHPYNVSWTSTGGATECLLSGAYSEQHAPPNGTIVEKRDPGGNYTYSVSCSNPGCNEGYASTPVSAIVPVGQISCYNGAIYSSDPVFPDVQVGTGYPVGASFQTNHGAIGQISFEVPPAPPNSAARLCDVLNPDPPDLCDVSAGNSYMDNTSPFQANLSIIKYDSDADLFAYGGIVGECPDSRSPDMIPCNAPAKTDLTMDYTNAWFQTERGNVFSRMGVSTAIPATAPNKYFIRQPQYENVGVLISSSSANLGSGMVSIRNISAVANTTTKPESSFDLFFNTKLPEIMRNEIKSATTSSHLAHEYQSASIPASNLSLCDSDYHSFRGYKICYYDGSYLVSGVPLGDLTLTGNYAFPNGDRIILFVENANVTFEGKITPVTRGRSSFLVISQKDILIDPAVGSPFSDNIPDLEGVFYTDKNFSSGHDADFLTDENLHIRGAVVANKFNMQRDLVQGTETNETYPGEYFSYGTEQIMAFPPFLKLRPTYWQEVNP